MSLPGRIFFASALLSTLGVGCEGDSKTNFDDNDTGGSPGAGEGGTGAGSSGGSTTAGSSGTSSGKGGSAGSSTGGSPATGGTGGTAGSAGAGGSGAMRGYRPPDGHIQGCRTLCEKEAAAMCSNETTFEKCVEDCNVGILLEPCADLWDPVNECVEATETVGCSAEGQAILPDCIPPYIEYVECVSTAITTGPLGPECSEHCTSATAAACPNGETMDDCVRSCRIIIATFPVCADTFAPYLACGAAAEQTCDADGEPVATGCAGSFGTFLDCLAADYGWQPGRGLPQ